MVQRLLTSCQVDGEVQDPTTGADPSGGGAIWEGPKEASLLVDQKRVESETAAQRAYFCHGEVELEPLGRLILMDLEFPTRPRGSRIDLLAMPERAPEMRCIIEMKYTPQGKKKGDSPVAALFQALSYAQDAELNLPLLANQDRHNISRRDFPRFPDGWTPCLVVAANRFYWSEWERKLETEYSQLTQLASVVSEHTGIEGIHWASFADLKPGQAPSHPSGKVLPRVTCADCRWETPRGL